MTLSLHAAVSGCFGLFFLWGRRCNQAAPASQTSFRLACPSWSSNPCVPSHIISKQALNIYIDTGITAFGFPVGFDFSCLDVELLRFRAVTICSTEALCHIYPPIRDPSPEAKGIFTVAN